MAKKLKVGAAPLRERTRLALRRYDLCFFLLVLVILVATWSCRNGGYQLRDGAPTEFAAWFLLFFSYIPITLLSAVAVFFHVPFDVGANPAWWLGGCALVLTVASWLFFRIYALKRNSNDLLRIVGNFAKIIFVWGMFQLACGTAYYLWQNGNVTEPLHRGLVEIEQSK